MGRFLTISEFTIRVGEAEVLQIAGNGDWNTPEGPQVDAALIESAIAFADELIGGYVLARHSWLADTDANAMPDLLKGLASDVVRYRLRDRSGDRGEIAETVERRYRDALKAFEAIRMGKIDLVRDRADGADLAAPSSEGANSDRARISGAPSQANAMLEGYQ